MHQHIKFALILSVLFLYFPILHAAEISGITFSDHYHSDQLILPLQGLGVKNVMFFKAFVAAYYTNKNSEPDALGEYSKRIEVEYFVNIPGKKLNAYTLDRMKYNVRDQEMQELKPELALMEKYFVDLKPGDRFALTYEPGMGTKFEYRGRLVGIVDGASFAKALFSVWIGEKPFDEQLKAQILGSGQQQIVATTQEDITPGYATKIIKFGPREAHIVGSVKYARLGHYKAHFNRFHGSIAVDDASNNIQSVLIEIESPSIQSTCQWCDAVVMSRRLLNTEQFPQIIFKGKEIVPEGEGFKVNGTIEMHGQIKSVSFPLTFEIKYDRNSSGRILVTQGQWRINRKDFGIVWSHLLDRGGYIVDDHIVVDWHVRVPIE